MVRGSWKKIGESRMAKLFEFADRASDLSLATRYVALARRLSMRLKIRIPRVFKRKFCRHCYAYLRPGRNMRVRIDRDKVIITCLECKRFTRVPTRS